MKNLLLSFMVLVMFTPSLACAQFMGKQSPQDSMSHMAVTQMAKDMPCCPKSKTTRDMGIMFFKDCMKIDLQQASNPPLLKKVDIAKFTFPFIQSQAFNKELPFTGSNKARDPPFERRLSLSEAYPPIFLTTQRLRI